jgi:hypothetical protein
MCVKSIIIGLLLFVFTNSSFSQPVIWNLPSKENSKLLQPEAVSAVISDA